MQWCEASISLLVKQEWCTFFYAWINIQVFKGFLARERNTYIRNENTAQTRWLRASAVNWALIFFKDYNTHTNQWKVINRDHLFHLHLILEAWCERRDRLRIDGSLRHTGDGYLAGKLQALGTRIRLGTKRICYQWLNNNDSNFPN